MSTRSQVYVVEGDDYSRADMFYHHCDGYPAGVGKNLCKFARIAAGQADVEQERASAMRREFLKCLENDGDYERFESGFTMGVQFLYLVRIVDDSIAVTYVECRFGIHGNTYEECLQRLYDGESKVLYGGDEMTKSERKEMLKEQILQAKRNADLAARASDDGGTCNFDMALVKKEPCLTYGETIALFMECGIRNPEKMSGIHGGYIGLPHCVGQANRNTVWAETFARTQGWQVLAYD